MPALPYQSGAKHFQCLFVIAFVDFPDAALDLKQLLSRRGYLHPVCPAHQIVTETVALDSKHRFCACPLAISRQ